MKTHFLEGINLAKSYGNTEVLSDINIRVNRKEIVGLLGPNGSGKTTCFYLLIGLLKPDRGQVLLNGLDITRLPIYKRGAKGLGYLPQESSVFRDLRVDQNIMAALEFRLDLNRKTRKEQMERLLTDFSLSHIRSAYGRVLSGGERRRTEMARLLAMNPSFVLFDEPFAGVDPISVTEIKKLIVSLKEKNIGILINDHNVAETLKLCDRNYVIGRGKILAQGNKDDIVKDKLVREIYLGKEFSL